MKILNKYIFIIVSLSFATSSLAQDNINFHQYDTQSEIDWRASEVCDPAGAEWDGEACSLLQSSSNQKALDVPERTLAITDYHKDWNTFNKEFLTFDMSMMFDIENQDPVQVNDAIEKMISQIKSIKFQTSEGKKVQENFIAYSKESQYALKNHKNWKDDQKLAESLASKLNQLNQQLIESILTLKFLAEK